MPYFAEVFSMQKFHYVKPNSKLNDCIAKAFRIYAFVSIWIARALIRKNQFLYHKINVRFPLTKLKCWELN